MSLILYSYFRSSSSYRVRIALNLKGLEYEIKPVHLMKSGGEQNMPEYKNLNPLGEVPCLVHDEMAVGQSMAIIEYLDRIFPEKRLFPVAAAEGAHVRHFCEGINSGIQPFQNLKVLQKIEKDFGATQEMKSSWAKHWITEGFKGLERLLEKHSRKYSFGDELTAADCFLIPQVFSAKRFNVDMIPFKKIQSVYNHCTKLPEFVKASPENQVDFE
ncbi:MAG: maleylacetoacetate isomerase [Pseudomonadota bacterium]|nr:maleylacetoacetate isomerase [Pseudomonadota bacterium]